jgi:hypothetical protein
MMVIVIEVTKRCSSASHLEKKKEKNKTDGNQGKGIVRVLVLVIKTPYRV